jgi:hypothetical protein
MKLKCNQPRRDDGKYNGEKYSGSIVAEIADFIDLK